MNPEAPPKLPRLCAGLSLAIALVVLAGWASGEGDRVALAAGLPKMVPLTASMVAVGAVGLWAKAIQRNLLGLSAGIALLAAGFMTELFWFVGRAPQPFAMAASGSENPFSLSSPLTAVMSGAVGASLILMRPRRIRLAQSIAIGQLLLALLTLAGFFLRNTFLYQLLPGRGTSILTTTSFVLLSVGLLFLHTNKGIMVAVCGPMPSARVARRLLLAALAVPVLLAAGAFSAIYTGVVDPNSAISFLTWGTIVLFSFVILRFAMQLYRLDLARGQAEDERQKALQALRAADARKDEFLAMLAHELRNPLAPISAAAELLRRVTAPEPAQLRRTSDIISRQVSHMVHLVDDLLDVSRVTRGQIKLDKSAVDLHSVIADATEQVRPLMLARRHQLEVALDPAPAVVDGDHKRLVQVVANLLNNAARYTPPGGLVQLAMQSGPDQVEIVLRDSGIGIDPALIPHLFDLFTQAQRSADRSEGGLGLGLALVRSLTELHGGRVHAESAGAGLGSTFTVVLPSLHGVAPAAPARAQTPMPARKCRDVLVVDDNVDAADALAAVLRADCHQVVVEHSSEAALAKVGQASFDACLIDIGLPGMDGNQLARALRAAPATRRALLVAVTGYGAQSDRAMALAAGFDHYFVKPVPPEQLAQVLFGHSHQPTV